MQYDFMPGGALAVAEGDAILPLVNRLAAKFDNVALTQDWHPPGHASFASSHQGAKAFDKVRLFYGEQVLWPDHCVQGSDGARLHEGLAVDKADSLCCAKAPITTCRCSIPPLSWGADGASEQTGLAGFLREQGSRRRVFLSVGSAATDYCVAFSARRSDARAAGFEALVVEDASPRIDMAG